MKTNIHIQCDKLIHLEDSMVIYGIYNAETLERLIDTIHIMHNTTTSNERLFTGELSTSFTWYINKNGVNHYAIISLLYQRTLKEKYVKMYEKFILQLCMYA